MNNLLNVEVVSDNLIKFDESRENTQMALEKEPEDDLLEGFSDRLLEKLTSMQYASALYHSDSGHQNARAQEVQSVHAGALTELEAGRKEILSSGRQVRPKSSNFQIPGTATRQAEARQEEKVNLGSMFNTSHLSKGERRVPDVRQSQTRTPT